MVILGVTDLALKEIRDFPRGAILLNVPDVEFIENKFNENLYCEEDKEYSNDNIIHWGREQHSNSGVTANCADDV
ncbi:MAG: hypothetical protein WD688_11535 [Candidatus Binatia bacterium]